MSASFPGAVKTFATRNAGDVIQPAHINDLQDEVNAIEAGLLNGTAPLNSSNSTFASISVPGLAKFNGIPYTMPSSGPSTGQVLTCVSTSGSTAGLEWRSPSAKNYGHFTQRSTQSITNNTWIGLNFDTDVINSGGLHSTSANSSRITFTVSTGVYLVSAKASFSSNASANILGIRLVLNDVTVIAAGGLQNLNNVSWAPPGPTPAITALQTFTSTGDYLTVQVFQNVGTPLQTPLSTAAGECNMVSVVQIA